MEISETLARFTEAGFALFTLETFVPRLNNFRVQNWTEGYVEGKVVSYYDSFFMRYFK